MSKTIKLEEKTYHQLDQLRGKRDTFSDIVAKLLTTKEGVDTIAELWSHRTTSDTSGYPMAGRSHDY